MPDEVENSKLIECQSSGIKKNVCLVKQWELWISHAYNIKIQEQT